jgi:hypothetical protein
MSVMTSGAVSSALDAWANEETQEQIDGGFSQEDRWEGLCVALDIGGIARCSVILQSQATSVQKHSSCI